MVKGPIEEVSDEEVKRTLKEMKSGKVPGPTGMTSDLIKRVTITGELTGVFSGIFDEVGITEEWKNSVPVLIYKGKGDALECGKYRGIILLEHGMKLFEKLLEERWRKLIKVDSQQFGFCPGGSITDASFIIRQLQEKFSGRRRNCIISLWIWRRHLTKC